MEYYNEECISPELIWNKKQQIYWKNISENVSDKKFQQIFKFLFV